MSYERLKGKEKPKEDPPPKKKEEYGTCPTCQGKGKVKPPNAKREAICQRCKGTGKVVKSS